MRDIVLLFIVGVCALVALRRPWIGVLAFVWVSVFNPNDLAWEFGRTLPSAFVIAAATIIGYLFTSDRKSFPMERESILLLALWLLFGVTTFFAMSPTEATDALIEKSKILLMVFVSTALINTRERLRYLALVIALSLGFYAVKGGIFFVASGGQDTVWGPENSFLFANNAIGLALAMNLPLLVVLRRFETSRPLRLLLLTMAICTLPAVIGTFSRGAWIALGVAAILTLVRTGRRTAIVLIVAGAAIAPIFTDLFSDRVVQRYQELTEWREDRSAQSRLDSWQFCTTAALAQPVVGNGFGYYSVEAYRRYAPEFLEKYPDRVWSCHSSLFSIWGEHGFGGLALWGGLALFAYLSLRRLRNIGRRTPALRWMVDYSDMLTAAVGTYLVGASFYDAAYFDLYYHLIGMIIIMKAGLKSQLFEPVATAPPAVASRPLRAAAGASALSQRN